MGILGDAFTALGSKLARNTGKVVAVGSSAVVLTTLGGSSGPSPQVKPAGGALSALDASNSPFNYERLEYPISGLGEGQKYPHYITFYVNTREQSKYTQQFKANTTNRESVLQQNARRTATYNNLQLEALGEKIGFKRKTTRTTQSIRLYMPDTLHWTFRNQWKDVTLTDSLPLTKTGELAADLVDAVKKGFSEGGTLSGIPGDLLKKLAPLGAERLLSQSLGIDRDLAVSTLGYAINPNIDVIYGAPDLRSFVFDFLFAPRNSAEASMVLSIIRTFKFHAAPESSPDSGAGRYWIPPTEFDIDFSVDTMGKVSTCVLETIDVDYAPNGWSAYREEISRSDMPSNIRMQLVFRELEYMTKERIAEGY